MKKIILGFNENPKLVMGKKSKVRFAPHLRVFNGFKDDRPGTVGILEKIFAKKSNALTSALFRKFSFFLNRVLADQLMKNSDFLSLRTAEAIT